MVLLCLYMMYKYYYFLGFPTIKHNEEGNDIYKEVFQNILHLKNIYIRVNFRHDGFVMYNDNVLI